MYAELRHILESDEFEDDGKIVVSRQELGHSEITIGLEVSVGTEPEVSRWTITCSGYRRFRIEERVVRSLGIEQDHVVIAACDEKRYDLYFAGKPANPHEVVGRLVLAHRAAVGEWLPLSEFFNPATPPLELFSASSGLVGRAPHRIARRYLEALREGGVDAYLANEGEPKRWDGAQWVSESELLSALILGNNYVVAERFSVSRDAG